MTQFVQGNSVAHIKFGDPRAFEIWNWDENLVYHQWDNTDGTNTGYHLANGVWAKRRMSLGESVDTGNSELTRYSDCNTIQRIHPWRHINTLLSILPQHNVGGDIGVADVIVLKYDPTPTVNGAGNYEYFYFARGWGWYKWESYRNETGEKTQEATFDQLRGDRVTPNNFVCVPY